MTWTSARLFFALFAFALAVMHAPPAHAEEVTVTVYIAPTGTLAVDMRDNTVLVTDTRSDQPGWSVDGIASVLSAAQPVALADGRATSPPRSGNGQSRLLLDRGVDAVTFVTVA